MIRLEQSFKHNVLVTGGTGFLGRKLVSELLSLGHAVTVLTRDVSSAEQLFADELDLGTGASKTSAVQCLDKLPDPSAWSFSVVINLAGTNLFDKRWTAAVKTTLRESRIKTTQLLIDAIAQVPASQRPKLMLSGSAIGFYGNFPPSAPAVDESTSAGDDFAAQLCKDWEVTARQAGNLGIPVAILRTGVVLDTAGGALQRMLTPFKLGLGGRLGHGKQMFSWITRDDWVRAVLFIMKAANQSQPEKNKLNANLLGANSEPVESNFEESDGYSSQSGAWNMTAPHPVSNQHFTKALGSVLNRPTIFTVPAILLRFLVGESSRLLLEGQAVLPSRAMQAGFMFKHHEIKPALQALIEQHSKDENTMNRPEHHQASRLSDQVENRQTTLHTDNVVDMNNKVNKTKS